MNYCTFAYETMTVLHFLTGGFIWHLCHLYAEDLYAEDLSAPSIVHLRIIELARTVYDRIFGDFPAKNTVYKPYMYGSGQPYVWNNNRADHAAGIHLLVCKLYGSQCRAKKAPEPEKLTCSLLTWNASCTHWPTMTCKSWQVTSDMKFSLHSQTQLAARNALKL